MKSPNVRAYRGVYSKQREGLVYFFNLGSQQMGGGIDQCPLKYAAVIEVRVLKDRRFSVHPIWERNSSLYIGLLIVIVRE